MGRNDVPKLLTMSEVSEVLGICDRTLRSHIKAGLLAYISVGRTSQRVHRMFHPADVSAFIEARRIVEAPPQRAGQRRSAQKPSPHVIDFTTLRPKRAKAPMPR